MAKRSTVLVGIALGLAVLAAEPATASFPGRNGEIALMKAITDRSSVEPFHLLRFAPRLGDPTRHDICGHAGMPRRCDVLVGPAFRPDGSRFVAFVYESPSFAPNFGPQYFSLWFLNPQGRRVNTRPVTTFYSKVRWAPDASALVASRGLYPEDDDSAVVVLNPDGSERELVAAQASQPDWCADGRVIVVQYGEIRVVEPDGGLRRLTWRGGSEPSCSPDSRRVAFTREGALWTVPLAGGRARRLTRGHMPVFSPDGRQVAYLRDEPAGEHEDDTFLYRIGLRHRRVRGVSKSWVTTDRIGDESVVIGIDWRPLPPR
jgi:Tol biopolymer transport system component